MAVTSTIAVPTYLPNAIAATAPDIEDLQLFSPFNYYKAPTRSGTVPTPDI